jgi:hypothetical protein
MKLMKNKIKKLLAMILMLQTYSLCTDDVCSSLKRLISSDSFNSLKVYTYIQNAGAQIFNGQEKNGNLENLLKDDPDITVLKKGNSDAWNEFNQCISNYFNEIWNRLPIASKKEFIELQKAESQTGVIAQINLDLPYYSKILNIAFNTKSLKKLEDQINDLTALYIYSLNKLPQPEWYVKSVSDLIEAYNDNTVRPFELKKFFNEYTQVRNIAEKLKKDKGLTESLYRAFVFNKFLVPGYLQFFNEEPFKYISNSRAGQLKVSIFIDFLEELIYQSKMYKPKYFWSSRPKDLLTREQQGLAREIIDILYSIYPGVETSSLMKKIVLANSQEYKVPLLFFAQSRILLIALHAYLRKATREKQRIEQEAEKK